MIIYKLTHIPTGKIYIGSLKDPKRWPTYNSSSRTVKVMIETQPKEWLREITHSSFLSDWTYKEVVDLENQLIRDAVITIGWDAIWNQHYGANAYSPEAMEAAKAAMLTPEWKSKRSINSKKWFIQNPEKAEKRRVKITQTMMESIPRLRELQLEYIRNNPEGHQARQAKANEGKRKPEARKRNSQAKIRWYEDNPDMKAELYKKITQTKHTEESKARMSIGQVRRFKDPKELERNRKMTKTRFEDPKEKELASQRTKAFFSKPGVKETHQLKQIERFGKLIEVTFEDGTKYQCAGRKALETKLGCAGILRVIKGLRKYATCMKSEFSGKKIISARYIEE